MEQCDGHDPLENMRIDAPEELSQYALREFRLSD